VQIPHVRYAKNGDVHIAYQVVGDGPIDLLVVPGFVSHLECTWEQPAAARFTERLAAFCRLIVFDKRGTGLSDRGVGVPSLEVRMDDIRAVMDAVGSERAALFGASEGGLLATLFAATHPDRVASLILFGAMAKFTKSDDYPWGFDTDMLDMAVQALEAYWGTGITLYLFGPSRINDRELLKWCGRFERLAASPGAVLDIMRMNAETDVRHALPAVQAPTLVLHRTEDFTVPVEVGRYLARNIDGARYVELPGSDHTIWLGETEGVLAEVQEFLTGDRPVVEPERVLATVLFTDIVKSTELASKLGDRRWSDLLARHDALVRRQFDHFRGREVKTTGDGFLATFDGPARAIRCAQSIVDGVRGLGLEVRAGLHTGECEVDGASVGGIAVHTAARVVEQAEPGQVLVSSTVRDLVAGSGITFVDTGSHDLRGVPGPWQLLAVV
jgi:class 3 adenylate cyclase